MLTWSKIMSLKRIFITAGIGVPVLAGLSGIVSCAIDTHNIAQEISSPLKRFTTCVDESSPTDMRGIEALHTVFGATEGIGAPAFIMVRNNLGEAVAIVRHARNETPIIALTPLGEMARDRLAHCARRLNPPVAAPV